MFSAFRIDTAPFLISSEDIAVSQDVCPCVIAVVARVTVTFSENCDHSTN